MTGTKAALLKQVETLKEVLRATNAAVEGIKLTNLGIQKRLTEIDRLYAACAQERDVQSREIKRLNEDLTRAHKAIVQLVLRST
jgi:hypothetical protein